MRLAKWLSGRKTEILDLVYPRFCFGCQKTIPTEVAGFLCPDCISGLDIIKPPCCAVCGRPLRIGSGVRCQDCSEAGYYFTRGFTAVLYQGLVKDCIHRFKYDSRAYLGYNLARLLIDFSRINIDTSRIEMIMPVPLHWRKLRDRGFNQAAILGKELAGGLGKKYAGNVLMRSRPSQAQVGLPRRERLKNIRGVFAIRKPAVIQGKHILLIDDVMTTGATLNECSRVLLSGGAREVWIFAVARGFHLDIMNRDSRI